MGVNHLASCAASILQLPPTTTHLPLGRKEINTEGGQAGEKGKGSEIEKEKRKKNLIQANGYMPQKR